MELFGISTGWSVAMMGLVSLAAIATAVLLIGCVIAETCASHSAFAHRQRTASRKAATVVSTAATAGTYRIAA